MSTILEERPAVVSESKKAEDITWNGDLVSTEQINRGNVSVDEDSGPLYEIVFPVSDGKISEKSLEFLIQTAKKLSSGVTLVYASKPTEVPSGFIEYAKCEGIRDYEARFYESIANERLSTVEQRLLEAGVPCKSRAFIGRKKDAVKSYSSTKNALIVLNGKEEKWLGRRSGISVPVLLI